MKLWEANKAGNVPGLDGFEVKYQKKVVEM